MPLNADGTVELLKGKAIIKRVPRLSKNPRIFIRNQKVPILRGRRERPKTLGILDPLERRAVSKSRFPNGTLPERIMFKALSTVMQGDHNFIFQRDVGGGRNFIGGFVIDFLIIDRTPNIAIETLGSFWHQAANRFADEERALAVISRGFKYHEVWDYEIFQSDLFLEEIILTRILGRQA